ncbi:MAG: hypothetical protein PF549_02815 [Patescibacteria group bacterium]|nr:hypothetical protein [Patescibacteria group bacterium]
MKKINEEVLVEVYPIEINCSKTRGFMFLSGSFILIIYILNGSMII